ncbi:FG-GAP-like repeat-containing protein [Bacteroidota bacterium]
MNIKIQFVILVTVVALQPILNVSSQQVSFKEHLVDNQFDGPAGLYVKDVDRNGFNDIIAAGSNGNDICLWLHNGENPVTWTKETVDPNFSGAIYVFAEDIDGDSLIDLVAAGWYANQIAWWKNLGGTNPIVWKKQVIDSSYLHAHEVFVIDLDKDTHMDVIGASAQSHSVTWWRNDGGDPVNWTKQDIGTNFTGSRSICAEDIDGDNDYDIAGAALLSNEIAWWRNDGGNPIEWTKFSVANNFNGAHKVCLFDLDGDQDPDILGTAYMINQIAWWRNDGGNPVEWTKIPVTSSFNSALISYPQDIDLDGDIDVVGTAQNLQQVAWWSNEGSNPYVWDKNIIKNSYTGVWPLFISDLDNDSDYDIVSGAANLDQIHWWENSLYSADFQTNITSGQVPLEVQFTDLSNLSQTINSWEWDFDNDGTIDSYDENPTWTYNAAGTYAVYLKVSDGESEDVEIKDAYISTSVSGIQEDIFPEKIKLHQNYPNPFNPSTTIRYELPEGSNVTIKIYNLLGKEIIELVNEFQQTGFKIINWDGKDESGYPVNSGMYLYTIKSNNFSQTKKMLVIK